MATINPDEPFSQSLRKVARELLTTPVKRGEMRYAIDGLKAIGLVLLILLVRVVILGLYPISVPLLTYFARLDEKLIRKQHAEARARANAHFRRETRDFTNTPLK